MTRAPRRTEPDDATLPHSVFLRGLSLGALIGAAIAGSAIWDRRRQRAKAPSDDSAPAAEPKA